MIGQAITKIMKDQGCTPSLLAMHLMVTQPAVNKFTGKNANPTDHTLTKIAKVLNVKVSDIYLVKEALEDEQK